MEGEEIQVAMRCCQHLSKSLFDEGALLILANDVERADGGTQKSIGTSLTTTAKQLTSTTSRIEMSTLRHLNYRLWALLSLDIQSHLESIPASGCQFSFNSVISSLVLQPIQTL